MNNETWNNGPVSSKTIWLAAIAVMAVAALIYLPVLNYGFVYDDFILIVNKSRDLILSLERVKALFMQEDYANYLPLRALVYLIIHHFWELNPLPYHVVNIALYALNCLLVFTIAVQLQGNTERTGWATPSDVAFAFVAAMFFAIHPLHVEAVAWISGLKEVLSSFFYLLGLAAFIKYRASSGTTGFRGGYAIALICFILATFSKATAVTFPLILILYDFLFPGVARRSSLSGRLFEHFIMLLVMAGSILLNYSLAVKYGMVHEVAGGSLFIHIITIIKIIPFYLKAAAWPFALSVLYEIPNSKSLLEPAVLVAIVALTTMAAAFIYFRKRNPLIAFGVAWFLIALLPTLQVLPFSTMAADRYVYLPLYGLCLVAAGGVSFIARAGGARRMVAVFIFLILSATFIYGVEKRNPAWKNSVNLWEATIETNPGLARPYANLGGAYLAEKRLEDAKAVLDKAMEIDKTHLDTYIFLSMYYVHKEEYQQAYNVLKEGKPYGFNDLDLNYHIAIAMYYLKEYKSAAKVFAVVIRTKPHHRKAERFLGKTLFELKKTMEDEEFKAFLNRL